MTNQEKELTEKLQKQYEKRMSDPKNMYDYNRRHNYPSIQEQLDMQYWDAVNGTKKWQEAVAKVKTDNPKPE
jgi:hypothetical protein